jgi:hypothetical protein
MTWPNRVIFRLRAPGIVGTELLTAMQLCSTGRKLMRQSSDRRRRVEPRVHEGHAFVLHVVDGLPYGEALRRVSVSRARCAGSARATPES